MVAERTQPQNEAYERAVLGACLMSAESVAQAVEALRPADFYRPAHGRLFAILKAHDLDRDDLAQLMEDQGWGDDPQLLTLEAYEELTADVIPSFGRAAL